MYNQIYVEDECIYACPFLTDCPLYRKKKEILYFNTLTKKIKKKKFNWLISKEGKTITIMIK